MSLRFLLTFSSVLHSIYFCSSHHYITHLLHISLVFLFFWLVLFYVRSCACAFSEQRDENLLFLVLSILLHRTFYVPLVKLFHFICFCWLQVDHHRRCRRRRRRPSERANANSTLYTCIGVKAAYVYILRCYLCIDVLTLFLSVFFCLFSARHSPCFIFFSLFLFDCTVGLFSVMLARICSVVCLFFKVYFLSMR